LKDFENRDDLFPDKNFPESAFEPISVDFPQPDAKQPGVMIEYDRNLQNCNNSKPPPNTIDRTAQESQRNKRKYLSLQPDKWLKRFLELVEYEKAHQNCLVPHDYTENIELSRWVKRQRYQYKLYQSNEKSSMTDDRIELLEDIGFVWDAQEANWQERFEELVAYKAVHGNCDVNTKSSTYFKLGTWVRCQRRQYQLFADGRPSNMTQERIARLEKLGFNWKIRNLQRSPDNLNAIVKK